MWPGGANCEEAGSRANLFAMPQARQYMWPGGANCEEAESRANLFAMPQAQQYMWPGGANCEEAESRANLFALPRRNSICDPKGQIAKKPRAVCVTNSNIQRIYKQGEFICYGRAGSMRAKREVKPDSQHVARFGL